MSKRKWAVLLSMLLTLLCCGFAASEDGPPVSMEVSSIYGNIGKMGVHVPLSVRLYGQKEGQFTGILCVQTLENGAEEGEEIYEYQYPVEIGMAETKEMKLYVPLGQRSSETHVILKDTAGDEIVSKNIDFEISKDRGRLLIGAFTERFDEIEYLDGVSLDYGMVRSQLLELDEKICPDNEKGLELLDIIVINHFDTDSLSDRQLSAVKSWVEDGGTLLIGTGAKVYSTLGTMAEDLVELPIEGIYYKNINLGTEYAEKAPGDSDVNMAYADILIPDGDVVEESDGIPLLTMVKRGNGQVGIYSYDLGEITQFVEKNPSYVIKMLTNVLGEDKISQLYYYSSYGVDEDYWNAYSLVNTGSADRLPNLGMYAVVILIYIGLVGPGLYLFLKKKDMSQIYGTAVVVTSVGISAVIYLMGVGTRFTSQFFTVASVVEMDSSSVEETSYLNVRTPDNRPLSVTIPASYDVTPLNRTSRYNEQTVTEFEKEKSGSVELRFAESGTLLSAKKSKAFEPRFFKLTKESARVPEGNISGSLTWYDGKITGKIVNQMSCKLEDAALMLYGQMYLIGDMEPGETREFSEEELLVWPVGMSYMVSGMITGSDEAADKTDSEYLRNAEKSSLYTYYIGDKYYNYTSEARLLAMGPSGGILSDETFREQEAEGMVLYAANIDVFSGETGRVYRSGLVNKPEVTSGSGSFYGDGLTMYGTEPIAVEYFLGEGLNVEKLSFLTVSADFVENSDYYYVKLFDGAAYFYNRTTREYDRVDLSKVHFTAEELRPYLSQENSIIVKYAVGESNTAGVSSLLPHLMVTGRES